MNGEWGKRNENDKIWWWDDDELIGLLRFSFNKVTIYNFWTDYPSKLSDKQKEIFDKENPLLANLKKKKRV